MNSRAATGYASHCPIAGNYPPSDIATSIGGAGPTEDRSAAETEFRDDTFSTWGLHAVRVVGSKFTGRGVRVAALVDGLDEGHSDWHARPVVLKSFVAGEPPNAVGTSGTAYLGTAFGPARPAEGPRYGCAPDAQLYVAKVLNHQGMGTRASILTALEWAIANACRIILVPLGWDQPAFDAVFEDLASRASVQGALLVAGAGNNARRHQGIFGNVINPAACPSVMAVGAVDARLQLPDWTPRSSAALGGGVDLLAPGVDLRSSVPGPRLYGRFSGSATAASFVAGIATLWAEAYPQAQPHELWQLLSAHARRLTLPSLDAGAGLVQAP